MNISVQIKSILSNETAEIAHFRVSHYKYINIQVAIATKTAGQTWFLKKNFDYFVEDLPCMSL